MKVLSAEWYRRRGLASAVTVAICLSTAVIAGCGGGDEPSSARVGKGSATIPAKPEPGTFHMGISPWLGYGPWRIAEAKGFFEKNGLDVELTNFTTDDQINAAFASGKTDGTNVATHSALRFVSQGLPVKMVLLEDVSLKADAMLAGPDIESIEDLRGKKVAFEEGTTSDLLLTYALAQNGLSKSDIQPVPIPAADAGTAFIAGRVPVAVTYEPYLATALKQDESARLLFSGEEDPGLISDVFMVSEDAMKNKPGQVAALLKSWGEAVDFYNRHPKEGQAIIAKAHGVKPSDLTSAFAGVKIYDLPENKDELSGEFANTVLLDVEKTAKSIGLLEGDVAPEDVIVPGFVDAALR
jgi:NitT/TauT family transport system substrate-binding protein